MGTADSKHDAVRPPDGEVELGELSDLVEFRLRMAQNVSFRAFKRLTGEAHLRPGWYAVMTLIKQNPGITPMAVARASGRDKSTITPILHDLLRGGFVRRVDIPTDRRSYTLFLLPKGEQMREHLAVCAREHERELDAIVGDRKPELLRVLRDIAAGLE